MQVRVFAPRRLTVPALTIAALLLFLPFPAAAQGGRLYEQRNLVSDIAGLARVTDANLVNAWGLSRSPTGPWQVSDNGTGLSTRYTRNGAAVSPVVAVPLPGGGPGGAPTGNVFNGTSDFVVSRGSASGPSQFVFATEDGTISGWNPNVDLTHALIAVDRSAVGLGAVYKGLAIGRNSLGNFLYAANFRFGTIEMFDAQFRLARSFGDSRLSSDCPLPNQCFAPFGIQNLGGLLYVTYALQNAVKHDDVSGPGNGFVDVFDTNGNLVRRFAVRGPLNSPWGLAMSPAGFGPFSDDLLVGNFGDGHINAFDVATGTFLGQLQDQSGHALTIPGLWGLAFGNGGLAGDTNKLFFAAGINDEADGLFGSIEPA
jgi:uncharacterized protein (TIGR03118 family)